MKVLRFSRLWIISILIAAALFLAAGLIAYPKQASLPGTTIELAAPEFVRPVRAQAEDPILAMLDTEAGMSAYFKSSTPITLSQAKTAFRIVEIETANYIVGSVAITGFIEHFDAHVYVHKDGWILAYYMRNEPASKILDPQHSTITTTKLEMVVSKVADASGVAMTGISYYDFRYPAAEYILLVAEDHIDGMDFTINIPASYSIQERGWAGAGTCYYNDFNFLLNGTNLENTRTWGTDNVGYGLIGASQLPQNTTHTIVIENASNCSYGILMLTYTIP